MAKPICQTCEKAFTRIHGNNTPFCSALCRALPKVNKGGEGGCWLWTGRRSRSGGRFGQGGYGWIKRGQKLIAVHRLFYEAFVAPVPEGFQIDHLCRTPACVNPAHLEAVTPAENMRRWSASITHCKNGHEFTPENTRVGTRGERVCRACSRAAVGRYRNRLRRVSGVTS